MKEDYETIVDCILTLAENGNPQANELIARICDGEDYRDACLDILSRKNAQ